MEDQEKLIKELRAIIISSKGGITFRDLRRDYLDLGGSESVYKKIGYRTIESFVEANPQEFKVEGNGMIYAAQKEESSHIQRLVNQQGGKRRSRITPPASRRPTTNYNYRPRPAFNNPNRFPQPKDLRDFLNDKRQRPTHEIREIQEKNQNIVIRKTWPKELFMNDVDVKIPSLLESKVENPKKRFIEEASVPPPIFQYKAKEPVCREPYHHDKLDEYSNDEDDDDEEDEIFKDVPPLNDPQPVRVVNVLACTNPPKSSDSKQIPSIIQISKITQPNGLVRSPKKDKPKIHSSVPVKSHTKPIVSLPGKNPAASRLARLQAETKVQQIEPTTQLSDLIKRLDEFCTINRVSAPDIKTMSHCHGTGKLYTCLVKVGDNVFSSDNYVSNKTLAEMSALQRAFDSLNSEPAPQVYSEDILLYLFRLKAVLEKKQGGLWMGMIPEVYKETYRESVPESWENVTKNSTDFQTTLTLGKLLVNLNNTVSASSTGSSIPVSRPIQLPRPDSPPKIKKREPVVLDIPTGPFWDIYVLLYNNPSELVTRFIGNEYSLKHDEMLSLLEMEMLTDKKKISFPVVGEIYAVNVNGWVRGRLESILPDKMCYIYLIDEGECEHLNLDELYHLDDKYFDLAPQAFKIVLKGLEGFPEMAHLKTHISRQLLRRNCVAEIINNYPDQPNGVLASVVLWDTLTDDDININCLIMEQSVSTLADPLTTYDYPRDMIVSYVGDDVYLHAADKGIDCISFLIEFIVSCNALPPVKTIAFNKIYLALDPVKRVYQRAKVLEVNPEKLKILFNDCGNTCEIDKTDLYEIEQIALTLAPSQAVKVTLSGIGRLNKQQIRYLNGLAELEEPVVVKILEVVEGVPCVSLHRRSGINQQLQNVNNILMTAEKENLTEETLPIASLPRFKTFFSVRITLAVSPSVFTVQWGENINTVHDMMEELQTYNFNETGILNPSEIECEKIYAVNYANDWYRGEILHDMGNGDYSIKIFDFGKSAFLPITHIRQLPDKFKIYPKLAMRATLADIIPVNGDWSPSDCVFFAEHVLDRDLAGILLHVSYDGTEPILELQLIDTCDEDDVDIRNLLVVNGIAAP